MAIELKERERISVDGDDTPLGKRERTKAANRAAILDAARQVFSELGYGETTVRDIIRRTGLASGTFYNYFKSKEEVFEALSNENALRVRPRLKEERAKATTFEEFARGTFHTLFSFVVENESSFSLMRRNTGSIRVRMDTPEVVAGFDELQADIESAMEQGLIPHLDVNFLCASMIGIAFEIADRMWRKDEPDIEEATEFATAMFMGGVNGLAKNTK